jgi:hypothetical protein
LSSQRNSWAREKAERTRMMNTSISCLTSERLAT